MLYLGEVLFFNRLILAIQWYFVIGNIYVGLYFTYISKKIWYKIIFLLNYVQIPNTDMLIHWFLTITMQCFVTSHWLTKIVPTKDLIFISFKGLNLISQNLLIIFYYSLEAWLYKMYHLSKFIILMRFFLITFIHSEADGI